MELVAKVSIMCIISVILALVIAEKTPQFAICIVLITGIMVIGLCINSAQVIFVNLQELVDNTGVNTAVFQPVIKVCGISVVAKIAGDICKDAGFSSMTQKINLVASITSIIAIFPLFTMIIEILKDII